jgi:hypothetical protein
MLTIVNSMQRCVSLGGITITEIQSNIRAQIVLEASRLEEDATYSMKQHFLLADRLKRINLFLILANIFAGTAAGTAILSRIDESGIWTGLLAISVIIFSSLLLTFNPELTAIAHNDAGNRYLLLKGEARKLKNVDILVSTSANDLIDRLDALEKRHWEIRERSPLLTEWSYQRARVKIVGGECDYAVDNMDGPNANARQNVNRVQAAQASSDGKS